MKQVRSQLAIAVSPPGEPTHELRSDSGVVWNGSRSAWLGTEAQQPAGPSRPFHYDLMWQTIDATPYRDSRIELSAQFRNSASLLHFFDAPTNLDFEVTDIDSVRLALEPVGC